MLIPDINLFYGLIWLVNYLFFHVLNVFNVSNLGLLESLHV